ncbi:putative aminotransferase [Ephemeroptericola cinctiostellae]|uniref:Putative aminotransferase n=1 Tax=Ephemeroptericola cinctiostellae TaxID=2268024 RepID=A0A345D9N1_9BURK|nr:aspartate aminotransferase family protein [Ephemeroptericola cinctiostellae]AXF85069.1 putative aminotransferase [Ephemeroptericola cinctiostellae]
MINTKTAALQKLDSAHYLHPFTDHKDLASKGARIITRGEGVYVWDTEGNKILDGMSGLWCVNMGYGQTELVEAATQQMTVLPFYNSFFNTSVEPAIELAALLAEITPPQFNHVFYSSSGSESNDTILRMVRRYWDIKGEKQRKTIISRKNGYHGSTVAGASLGGMTGMHEQGDLPIPGIVHIEQPYFREVVKDHPELKDLSEDEFGVLAAGWLEEKILEVGADKVAAFIGEPVQGAGGVIIPPKTYWPEIQRICDKYGILLISDEVICGFGRLGTWFGCETMGTKPDFMTFAKGVTSGYIPLGGAMVSDRVVDVLYQDGDFNHGYTYSGHPVACAVAVANIKLMQKLDLVNRVKNDTGPYLKQAFESLNDHPLVADAKTEGMVAGLVMLKDKANNTPFDDDDNVGMICRGHCFDNGLVMRAVGDRMIIAPPLVISHAEIDELVRLARLALDATWADLKAKNIVQ